MMKRFNISDYAMVIILIVVVVLIIFGIGTLGFRGPKAISPDLQVSGNNTALVHEFTVKDSNSYEVYSFLRGDRECVLVTGYDSVAVWCEQ